MIDLQMTGKNIELTPEIRRYVQLKLSKMNRHLPNILKADVEIFEQKTKSPQHHFVVQVTVDSAGTLLRGEETAEDLFTAIDKVAAVMNRQIERYKGRLIDKARTPESSVRTELRKEFEAVETAEEEPAVPEKLVKVKRFSVKPMPITEAIDQMELLGHDFFLFINDDTEQYNLVYRRKDGNYGLIEPEAK